MALNNASKFNYTLFYTKKVPEIKKIQKEPNLNDAWLSGFTDAEGCFHIYIGNKKVKYYVRPLFILDQKKEENVLNKIALLFNTTTKAKIRKNNKNNIHCLDQKGG